MTALRANAHELRAFREELAALPADVQDVHLSWIFHKHPAKAQLPKRRRAAYCSTANEFTTSDEDEAPQEFVTSSEEEPRAQAEEVCEEVFHTSGDEPAKSSRRATKRASCYSITFCGHSVCYRGACCLLGVGNCRLERIRQGRLDGRRGQQLDRNIRASEPLRSCLRHLWRMYHQVAEGLPDSFVFDRVGAGQATIDIHPRRTPTA